MPKTNPKLITLIPGIDGNGRVLFRFLTDSLADTLTGIHSGIYDDPRIFSQFEAPHFTANFLQFLIKNIAEKTKAYFWKLVSEEKLTPESTPIMLVGYSFGCTLAVGAAQILKKEGFQVDTCLLDGPSPELYKKHFAGNTLAATNTLMRITDYVAESHAEIAENNLPSRKLTHEEKLKLSQYPVVKQLEKIYKKSKSADLGDPRDHHLQFYLHIVARNLRELLSNDILSNNIQLDSITVITTPETRALYQCSTHGGWSTYATKINEYELPDISHSSLLNKSNTETIVNFIVKEYYTAEHTRVASPTPDTINTQFLNPRPVSTTPISIPHYKKRSSQFRANKIAQLREQFRQFNSHEDSSSDDLPTTEDKHQKHRHFVKKQHQGPQKKLQPSTEQDVDDLTFTVLSLFEDQIEQQMNSPYYDSSDDEVFLPSDSSDSESDYENNLNNANESRMSLTNSPVASSTTTPYNSNRSSPISVKSNFGTLLMLSSPTIRHGVRLFSSSQSQQPKHALNDDLEPILNKPLLNNKW